MSPTARLPLAAVAAAAMAVVVATAVVAQARPRVARAVRVSKQVRLKKLHMYWVEPSSRNEAVIYALPAELAVGEEYDVVDSQGYVGRLRVSRVDDMDPKCKTLQLKRGAATYVSAPARDGTDVVAIGPNHAAFTGGRVVPAPAQGGAPAEPQNLYQRVFVDLDGDQAPDLMRDAYACDPAQQQQQQGAPSYCYDTWGRQHRGAWALIEHTAIRYCY